MAPGHENPLLQKKQVAPASRTADLPIIQVDTPTTNLNWFSIIAWRLAFPPILLWDAAKFLVNKLLGSFVGFMVLPAQRLPYPLSLLKPNEEILIDKFRDAQRAAHADCQQILVRTHDGAELDTTIFERTANNTPIANQRYIINFRGNGDYYEWHFEEMIADADALQAKVIGFNYRGVGDSSGRPKSQDDLVTDGIAQVQRLLRDGVTDENITLHGLSLGGAVASLVAKHFHDQGIRIKIFNERSFSTLTNVVVGWIRSTDGTGHRESTLGKLFGWIFYPLIRGTLALTGWTMDAAAAYTSIPQEYRQHAVARSPYIDRVHCTLREDSNLMIHIGSAIPSLIEVENIASKNHNIPCIYILHEDNALISMRIYGYYSAPGTWERVDSEFFPAIENALRTIIQDAVTTDGEIIISQKSITPELRALLAQVHASYRPDDRVIPHFASMHRALQSERRAQKDALDAQIAEERTANPSATTERLTALLNERIQMKAPKMVAENWQADAHNADRRTLVSQISSEAQPRNMQTFFYEFCVRPLPVQPAAEARPSTRRSAAAQ